MIDNELFSIIMPAFNAEKNLKTSVDSVLSQTESRFRLYIVNDASTDNTKKIIDSISDVRVVKIDSATNLGVAGARNLALKVANGKYISFLDSDDIWSSEKLEEQLKKLEQGWDVVSSNYKTFINDKNNVINVRISPEIITYEDMLNSNYIGNLTGVYNASKLGKYYQVNHGHEDYIMWLKIVKDSKKAYCIQKELAFYRLSYTSLSSNKIKAICWQWAIYRNVLRLPLLSSIYHFIFYVYLAFRKRR